MENLIQLLKHCVITITSWFYFIGRWSSFIYFFCWQNNNIDGCGVVPDKNKNVGYYILKAL